MRRTALGLILAAVLAVFSWPAQAQTVCSTRAYFVAELRAQHKETPVAMGLVTNGNVLEVLASEKGTWTILVTRPNGVSCVVAVGDSWETLRVNLVSDGPEA